MYYVERIKAPIQSTLTLEVNLQANDLIHFWCIENNKLFDLTKNNIGQFIKVNNEPFTTKGYIIVYGLPQNYPQRFTNPRAFGEYITAYTVYSKGIESTIDNINTAGGNKRVDNVAVNHYPEFKGRLQSLNKSVILNNGTLFLDIDINDGDYILAAELSDINIIVKSKIIKKWIRVGYTIVVPDVNLSFTPNKFYPCSTQLCVLSDSDIEIPIDIQSDERIKYQLAGKTLTSYTKSNDLFRKVIVKNSSDTEVAENGALTNGSYVDEVMTRTEPVTIEYGYEGGTTDTTNTIRIPTSFRGIPIIVFLSGNGKMFIKVNHPDTLDVKPRLVTTSGIDDQSLNDNWDREKTSTYTKFTTKLSMAFEEGIIEIGWTYD